MTFLLFEILCRKVKRFDQSQDYFHLVPKIFLEVGGNRVFGQSFKNLFEPFLCSSSSCSYFVSKRVLLYQSECVRVFPFSIVSKFFQQKARRWRQVDFRPLKKERNLRGYRGWPCMGFEKNGAKLDINQPNKGKERMR